MKKSVVHHVVCACEVKRNENALLRCCTFRWVTSPGRLASSLLPVVWKISETRAPPDWPASPYVVSLESLAMVEMGDLHFEPLLRVIPTTAVERD